MLNIKESVKILFIVTVLVLAVGCKKHNAEYTSSENTGDVSSVVSETTAESEAVSSAGNVTSTLSANVAQGSSAENSNIAKPDKTVSQVREQPKTSSAVPSNTDTAQTPPEIKPETPANATEADTKAVADRVIYYLNKARGDIGSGELKRLPRLTGYAEYRSSQLPSNFAHDISDWFAAAKATGYGRYTEMPDGSGSYDIGAQEAIAMAGIVGSADKIGQCLAQIIIDSSRHWLYVGSDEMKYTGVGVTCVGDLWYTAIMVTATDEYEK